MNIAGAWRALRRDWRAGDIQIIGWAVVIAVGGLVSVAALSDRLQRALVQQGAELLAADLVVRGSQPPTPAWQARARDAGLRTAQTVEFRSVVIAAETTQLAEVKAVSAAYPLRGRLQVADSIQAAGENVTGGPAPGTVWVDTQLLNLLQLAVGDSIQLGTQRFVIEKLIVFEPDRGGVVFSIAPRLMMNIGDLAATALVQPGSLVRYRWLLAGTEDQLEMLRTWLRTRGVAESDLQDVGKSQPRFRAALDRGERFLGLATLVSVLLAGVAIARASRHYAERHIDDAAIQRCFGASQSQIVRRYATQLLLISAAAGALGCAVGYASQTILLLLLPGLTNVELPPPSLTPALVGIAVGMVTVVGFGLPDILRLGNVPPLRAIRRDLDPLPPKTWVVYALAFATMAGLVFAIGRDPRLVAWVIGGTALLIVALAAAAWGLIKLLGLGRRGVGIEWRFGLGNLVRRVRSTLGQIVSLGLGAMAILLLTMVRQDLFDTWETRLPPSTPNHFLINIQAPQVDPVADFLGHRGVSPTRFTPIVRARLAAINGAAVDPDSFKEGFARRIVQRAANLSWMSELPADNALVSGQWWTPAEHGEGLLSMERGYAEALGLHVGDRVAYRVADRQFELRIASLREVGWDSFQPNFFLLVPPGILDGYPVSYITSVHVPRQSNPVLQTLIQQYPNITDIDVAALLSQVRLVLDRVSRALQYLFFFATAAGLVVLLAAIQTSRDERRREVSVLRALGANSRQIKTGLIAEFAVLGLCAGLVGGLGATSLGYALAQFVFDLPYQIDPLVWLTGAAVGALVVATVGPWVCRRDLTTSPWLTLSRVDNGA